MYATLFLNGSSTKQNGRHSRDAGYTADCWKANAAAVLGWLVFRATADMLQNDPARLIEEIRAAVDLRTARS